LKNSCLNEGNPQEFATAISLRCFVNFIWQIFYLSDLLHQPNTLISITYISEMFGTSRLKNVTRRCCTRKNVSVTLKGHKMVAREKCHSPPFHVLFVCRASLLTNRTNDIIWQSLTTNGKVSETAYLCLFITYAINLVFSWNFPRDKALRKRRFVIIIPYKIITIPRSRNRRRQLTVWHNSIQRATYTNDKATISKFYLRK